MVAIVRDKRDIRTGRMIVSYNRVMVPRDLVPQES